MKRIVAACLAQTNRFECEADYQAYLAELERKNSRFRIVDVQKQPDDSILVKIKKQYNSYDVGSYLED